MSDQLTPAQRAALEASEEKQRAEEAAAPPVSGSPGVTSVAEMISAYKRKLITLPVSGWVMEIQSLSPGDYLTVYGSAIRAMMTAAGLDYADKEERSAFEANMSPQQRAAVAESNLQNFRRIVAKSIVSIRVSLEPQYLCPPDVLSVYQIADSEVLFIHEEVDRLSGWSADVDRFQRSVSESEGGAETA